MEYVVGVLHRYRVWLPYALSFVLLIAFFGVAKPFWSGNDDTSMSLIANGGGLALVPSPRLVLTNIAWGYLIHWLPNIAHIRSYTWMTYLALAISYAAAMFVLARNSAHPVLSSILMLLVYIPVFLYPQFTLVAGYLAFSSLMLFVHSVRAQSIGTGAVAGILIVLSGLVRADETALVILVLLPMSMCYLRIIYESSLRWHWLSVIAITMLVFMAFQLLDYFTFSTGRWYEYAHTYALRTAFTDFKINLYFIFHPKMLLGTGYTLNDLRLFADWFYCDTRVFSPEKLAPVLQKLPMLGRLALNLQKYHGVLRPLENQDFDAFMALFVPVVAFHRHRWNLLTSVVMLGAVIGLLLAAGRAEVSRVYIPACAGILMVGATELKCEHRLHTWIITITALAITTGLILKKYDANLGMQHRSARIQALTCNLPKGTFLVNWGAHYPFALEYQPFEDMRKPCALDYYSFGEFSLAPFALDHLHAHTDGKDFVDAVLAGQSFDMLALPNQMYALQKYFLDHYQVHTVYAPIKFPNSLKIFSFSLAKTGPPAH